MKNDASSAADSSLTEVVIPKEKAVFWMDGQGRWHNRHGRFEHKRIIDYFNRSIGCDKDGYYITQIRGDIREKVYFSYDDTPLFVIRIIAAKPLNLVLNTTETIPLDPTRLFVRTDQLYQRCGEEAIKFSERALMELAPHLEEAADGLVIRADGQVFPIPEKDAC